LDFDVEMYSQVREFIFEKRFVRSLT